MEKNGDQSSDLMKKSGGEQHSSEYAPYPKIDPKDVAPIPQENLGTFVMGGGSSQSQSGLTKDSSQMADHHQQATTLPPETNPYISAAPVPSASSSVKDTMDSVRDALGRWGKKAAEAKKTAEDLAGNVWQHLKTAPSVTDAAMGRIAQSTKVLAEGGYEKVFRQSFETVPEEQLQTSYACYLSTSAGPVMGTLYLSTAKIAFCSDIPLSYKAGAQTDWSYYKVVIPLLQLKAVTPSANKSNPAEKYIQVISVDGHEFWFMGFVNYDSAVKCLQDTLQASSMQAV